MSERSPRTSQSREKESRIKPWRPPSQLDAPPPPEGYHHRWIRETVMGYDDRKNLSARLREGFELEMSDLALFGEKLPAGQGKEPVYYHAFFLPLVVPNGILRL